MSALENILARLPDARKCGSSWRAPCPSHGGKSLAIRDGNRGVLLKCWHGCETRDVLAAMGLTWSDLFNDPLERNGPKPLAAVVPRAPKPVRPYSDTPHGDDPLWPVLLQRAMREIVWERGQTGLTFDLIDAEDRAARWLHDLAMKGNSL